MNCQSFLTPKYNKKCVEVLVCRSRMTISKVACPDKEEQEAKA